MRRLSLVCLAFVSMLVFIPVAAAQDGSPEAGDSLLAGLGYPEIVISTDGTDFEPPAELEAGRYRLIVENTSDSLATDIELYRVPEDSTFDEIAAEFEMFDPATSEIPEVFFSPGFAHGGASAMPGQSGDVVVDLPAGSWAFNFFAYSPGDEEGDVLNLPKEVTVSGEIPEMDDPAAAVEVGMIELEFVMPDVVPAGPTIWKFVNQGGFPHHTIIQSYPESVTREQVEAMLAMFSGMEASPEAGATPVAPLDPTLITDVTGSLVLSSTNANWMEVDLEPGTYIALCFISGPGDLPPHAFLGMFKVFTVE